VVFGKSLPVYEKFDEKAMEAGLVREEQERQAIVARGLADLDLELIDLSDTVAEPIAETQSVA